MLPSWVALVLAILVATCAIGPAVLFTRNLKRYRWPRTGRSTYEHVAVLIPARNEENNIGACVESALRARDVEVSVWVCDDASIDGTAEIVQHLAKEDARVHLVQSPPLSAGWNGKQHACWKLARCGANESALLFLDADVRLHPWTIARALRMMRDEGLDLLSGFPRQHYTGFLDRLLLPLIHFVLLSYLPFRRMQKSTDPRFAAGCGQFLLVDRSAYFASGGHVEIRESRHDGLRMPRLFREHGFSTGLTDLTRLADVTMYETAGATWNGLLKNATEGMAARGRILPFTLLLFFGSIAPLLLVACWAAVMSVAMTGAEMSGDSAWDGYAVAVTALLGAAACAAFLVRLIACRRFKQPLWSALLHPLGVTLLLLLQWQAWLRERLGTPVEWRARSYNTTSGEEIDYESSYRS